MSHLRPTILTIALATAVIGAWAQTDAQIQAQHKQHQANVLATEQSSATPAASTTTPVSTGKMADMDSKMKAMAEMHQKMMAAKTPEEKKALMAEHMKTMQEGMKTMGMMGGAGMADMQGKKPMPGSMGEHHQMMEKRMAMMECMMQMMMDQMPAPAAN
jgi:hypothetical protein